MKYIIEQVKAPLRCIYREDISNYPGGDFRCQHHKGKNIRCEDEIDFPVKCPLVDEVEFNYKDEHYFDARSFEEKCNDDPKDILYKKYGKPTWIDAIKNMDKLKEED